MPAFKAYDASVLGLPSPTLTNPDMILPDELPRSVSPVSISRVERPPSPSSILRQYEPRPQSQTRKLATPPLGRRSGLSTPRPMSQLTARSSTSSLRSPEDNDATPKRRTRDDTLASSPTLEGTVSRPTTGTWRSARDGRASSNASSREHSERTANARRSTTADMEAQLTDDEDYGRLGSLPKILGNDEETDMEQWEDSGEEAQDTFGNDELSRRAEMILANAKKRLNACCNQLMEGNLRGARHSLLGPPTASYSSLKMPSDIAAARERDRQMYGGIGFIPPRQKKYHPSTSNGSSTNHSRVLSETSIPFPENLQKPPTMRQMRSSSALGSSASYWSPPAGAQHFSRPLSSVRETKSAEAMRGTTRSFISRESSLRRSPTDSAASPRSLDTLPEDDSTQPSNHTLRKVPSRTGDLRAQMTDLKNRMTMLKERATEENMKRRSMQRLRTPSPFTDAEKWYASSQSYNTSPISQDGGIGYKTKLAVPGQSPRRDGQEQYLQKRPLRDELDDLSQPTKSRREDVEQEKLEEADEVEGGKGGSDDDSESVAGESIYEDASAVPPERHEDRPDAFDYEHFFLHSAMGTYRASRPASVSSDESVATTRAVSPLPLKEESPQTTPKQRRRQSLHNRNPSADTISTVATFATANESLSSSEGDTEDENEQLEAFSYQLVAQQAQVHTFHRPSSRPTSRPTSRPSTRSSSTINFYMHPNKTLSIQPSTNGDRHEPAQDSTSTSPDVLASANARIVAILLEQMAKSSTSKRPGLEQMDKELISHLVESMQKAVVGLHDARSEYGEKDAWRARIKRADAVLARAGDERDR